MKYSKIQPPDFLSGLIKCFWTLDSDEPVSIGVIPDGSPGLIFQHAERGQFYDADNKHFARTFLYGQATRQRAIKSDGKLRVIGVDFQAHALKSLFRVSAHELTDACLNFDELPEVHAFRLSDKLLHASAVSQQVKILTEFFWAQLGKEKGETDPATLYALSEISGLDGRASLADLYNTLGLTERALERKFKKYVGISPRLFARICRFQKSLKQFKNGDFENLSDIAYTNSYADQSHFTRTFREFTGLSPRDFRKRSDFSTENFAEMAKK